MRHPITTTATPLPSITVDTRYSIENRTGNTVFIAVAAVAPDSGAAFTLAPSGVKSTGIFKAASGESVYVWSLLNGGAVVYDEAA